LQHEPHPAAHVQCPLLVKGVYAVHKYMPLCGQQHTVKELRHGGLAAAVMAQKGHELPLLNIEVYAVEHLQLPGLLGVIAETDALGFDE
jgi:hypothetical protein